MKTKNMIYAQEVELFFLMPAIRKEFAILMNSKGMKNKDIASILGVSEATISHYFKEKRAGSVHFDPSFRSRIEQACTKITDRESFIREMQRIVRIARDERIICKIHKEVSDVPGGCELCFIE